MQMSEEKISAPVKRSTTGDNDQTLLLPHGEDPISQPKIKTFLQEHDCSGDVQRILAQVPNQFLRPFRYTRESKALLSRIPAVNEIEKTNLIDYGCVHFEWICSDALYCLRTGEVLNGSDPCKSAASVVGVKAYGENTRLQTRCVNGSLAWTNSRI